MDMDCETARAFVESITLIACVAAFLLGLVVGSLLK
jgi:hypothetical protein